MSGVPMAEAILETRGLVKNYGATRALDGVSVAVARQETVGLVGRNGAGKSTLVRMLTGLDTPDAGEVRYAGEPAPDPAARDAWRRLVACVYQRSTVIPQLSVAENLFLNDHPERAGHVQWRAMRRMSRELLELWGVDVDPRMIAGDLPVGQRQLLEIVRALRRGSRFIILDEPTAQLELREIDQLFSQMLRLQSDGVTFLYISHHLDELYEVCDRVVVLRDGRLVADRSIDAMPKADLVSVMVGPGFTARGHDVTTRAADPMGAVVLEAEGVTVPGRVHAVSLLVRAGERVGLAGLTGSGRIELAEAIVGERRPSAGAIRVQGEAVRAGSVPHARDTGIGYVPGDRHRTGFCSNLSVEENATLTALDGLSPGGWISSRRRTALARGLIDALEIKVSSPAQLTRELSGGNQQKTVMARALAPDPKVLVLVSPTAGVDIASKDSLFTSILATRSAVLLVSDEIDELALCDRVLVMFQGRIRGEFARGWDERELVAAIEGMNQ